MDQRGVRELQPHTALRQRRGSRRSRCGQVPSTCSVPLDLLKSQGGHVPFRACSDPIGPRPLQTHTHDLKKEEYDEFAKSKPRVDWGIAIIILGIALAYGMNRGKGRTSAEKELTDKPTLRNYCEEDGRTGILCVLLVDRLLLIASHQLNSLTRWSVPL